MSLCHNVFGDGIRTLKCCEVLRNPLQQSKAVRTLRARPFVWLNVVCLDAPLVACVWQWFFARNFRIVVPVATTAALFLTAWLIYLIDRFADSVSLPNKSEITLREAFCLTHQNAWIGLTLAVGISVRVRRWQSIMTYSSPVSACRDRDDLSDHQLASVKSGPRFR